MKTKLQLRTHYEDEARKLYAVHIVVNNKTTTDSKTWAYGEIFDNVAKFLKKHTIQETMEHYQMCLAHLEKSILQTELNVHYQAAIKQVLSDLQLLSEIPKDGAVNRNKQQNKQ